MRTIGLSLILLAGCVDDFAGSNVQFDFAPAMPVQVNPGAAAGPTDLPTNVHYTLYAFQDDPMAGYLFAVQDFEIHHVIDLDSPCYIDFGTGVKHPGLHVSQYEKVTDMDVGIPDYMNPPAGASATDEEIAVTAHQRMLNITALGADDGLKAVTSASAASYPAVAADCNDTSKIPPPTCTDDASNKRRLDMCQAFWKANPGFYEGTDRVLTQALGGTTHGYVDGRNPINQGPVGGAQFFVDEALAGFTGFALYWQFDDADNNGVPDYPAGFPDADKHPTGQLLLYGTPTMPTRGVLHTHMTSPTSALTAELAIFANLDQDTTHF